jgi:hypothetical protein
MNRHDKATVTICCLTNHEIDPDEVDLRYSDPPKVREQLMQAADPCGDIQALATIDDAELDRFLNDVRDARQAKSGGADSGENPGDKQQ